ncbi:GNAT family N-acetyltransferase [Mumia sp. DW29H23]|uniref:GNAT family N-acetyltransferase n=1 Tax=Mumia sp. DW29H23 TaxID=3421241 RepID=UPI003D682FE4
MDGDLPSYDVRPLDASTWPDFAALAERHRGVWGGCWCLGFHAEGSLRGDEIDRRATKEALVREGRAHAALVYDGDTCVGWCQFGSVEELPNMKHRKRYEAGLTALPDWKITCFFVASDARRRGVSSVALGGALDQIARLGGGVVESYPEDAAGRKTSAGFLHNATASVFERQGFTRTRQIGKHHWVVTRTVEPAT